MSKKALVVQHNRIIEAKYRLSVGEQRLIKVLVSMIETDDKDFKIYRIAIADLVKLLGVSDNDFYEKVKEWSKNLLSSPLIFKGEGGDELQLTWLSSAEYKQAEGVVELEFSPKLKPFLLQLKKHFTAYEIANIIKLKRIYSVRLYELLKQYQRIGKRRFGLDELRQILRLEDNVYKGYKSFKRDILIPSQKELEENTDISFAWTEEKKWREVVAIEFIIKSQVRRQTESPDYGIVVSDKILEESPVNSVFDLPALDNANPQLVGLLAALGVSRKAAESLAKEYPEERIKAAIAYTQAQQKEGKIKNPSGFVVEAVKGGYRDPLAEERAKKEQALQDSKAREERAQHWKRLKTAYAEAKKATLEAWRSSLGEQELAEHREKFMETLAPMLRKSKNIVEQAFLAYLSSLMPFPSLREWAEQSRLNIAEFEQEIAREERQAAVARAKG